MIIDYYWLKKVLTKKEIKEINILSNLHGNIDDRGAAKGVDKTSVVRMVPLHYLSKALNNLKQNLIKINTYEFGYNLFPLSDAEFALHNTYTDKLKSEYGWHKDNSNTTVYDIKLSVLINTSTTNYKGGDFYMFLNGGPKKIKEFSEPGDVLIFKSYFFHKIEPVTKGERKSLSLFLSGPRLV